MGFMVRVGSAEASSKPAAPGSAKGSQAYKVGQGRRSYAARSPLASRRPPAPRRG